VFVLSILVYPLYDTFRVFVIRVFNGKSPFEADKNHIHHFLLDLGCTHKTTALILYGYTLTIIGLAFSLNTQSTLVQFVSVLSATICMAQIPIYIKRNNA
jgi:UDP-GlcNAc:undecaprenyl-phosphate/decaprenyl-phosphate GlcNAc-1-phosphate transferase